jgi:hypothetical protein
MNNQVDGLKINLTEDQTLTFNRSFLFPLSKGNVFCPPIIEAEKLYNNYLTAFTVRLFRYKRKRMMCLSVAAYFPFYLLEVFPK